MRTAQIWKKYTEYVTGQGDRTRDECAYHFGVHKTTATYHLERAVAEGALIRFYTWARNGQTGWAYKVPSRHEMFDEYEMGEDYGY